MIDFHSHILPGIDDGSRSVEMSLQMLSALTAQGVDTVVASSHFYATRQSPQHFLSRRQRAYVQLREALPEGMPEILLGAEVLYFPGISHMTELPQLCTEGTNILLLEMPFERWSEYWVREVTELAVSSGLTLLLAHIERYYFQQPVSVWDDFFDHGILAQANADFFLPFRTRRKAMKLLAAGRIHVLGSDAHNTDSRAPRLSEARAAITNKLGEEAWRRVDHFGRKLLRECAV